VNTSESQSAAARQQPSSLEESPTVKRITTFLFARYATAVLLVLLIVVFSVVTSQFLTPTNWQNLLVIQAVVSCTAFGAILSLVVGEFDLSLGSCSHPSAREREAMYNDIRELDVQPQRREA
jgi:ABC-type xylose transport system permease subunit